VDGVTVDGSSARTWRRPAGLGGRGACAVALVVACAAWPTVAAASLGGSADTVNADRIQLKGALIGMTSTGAYAVHSMQMASGTVVREYVSSTGTVFGVAWEGPWVPDLRTLLGPYFDRFAAAVAEGHAKRRGRGPLAIEEPGFVAALTGHPRAFAGRAYVPSLVPPGIRPAVVR
jgi:hypothetical protein